MYCAPILIEIIIWFMTLKKQVHFSLTALSLSIFGLVIHGDIREVRGKNSCGLCLKCLMRRIFCYDRAPLFEVQTDNWECFCAIPWDPAHADCAVPQVKC